MLKKVLRRIYQKLPQKQKKLAMAFYLYFLKIGHKVKWFHKNLRVSLIKNTVLDQKIADLNFFEQSFDSQNGEDGILKIIFHKIGLTNKFCVEFGVHTITGNTVHLVKNGWNYLWMDGEGDGKKIKQEFINAENINSLFQKYNVPKEFDLLSIDIDSNDYWVWQAINNYYPRVVVIEYNASIPCHESKTVKYDPNLIWDGSNYFGASLLALKKLGDLKGYTLIACDKRGVNAFFVQNSLIGDNFKIKDIKDIYRPPHYGQKINHKYIGHPPSDKIMIDV